MQKYSVFPQEMAASALRNRSLIFAMIKRDVVGRYRGSFMGILWSFFHPVFMLAVYTFVFSVVFQTKWGTGTGSKTEFALVLFSGLIIFNIFAECINRAPAIILSNVSYVKKVIFPLDALAWVSIGSVLFHATVSLSVWFIAYLFFFGIPHITVLLLPVVILPLILFTLGLTWILASLGVYLRDVSQFTTIVTTILMFLSPIFYPATAIPEKYREIMLLNPLAPAIEAARDVLFWGKQPNWTVWAISLAGAGLIMCVGFAWFQKTRKGFADVL